jgi:benzodiazapine receptor
MTPTDKPAPPRSGLAGFLVALAFCFAAAWLGSRFMPDAWYENLAKPALLPPDWVFPAAWTFLYFTMALAASLVWQRRHLPGTALALILFIAQLILNAAWPWLFFGLHRPNLAFAEIISLWLAIFATFLAFRRHTPEASLLLVPYLLWVGFAAWLNFMIWRLNP